MELGRAFGWVPLKTVQIVDEALQKGVGVLRLKSLDFLGQGTHVEEVVRVIDCLLPVLSKKFRKSVYVTDLLNLINNSLFIFQDVLNPRLFRIQVLEDGELLYFLLPH